MSGWHESIATDMANPFSWHHHHHRSHLELITIRNTMTATDDDTKPKDIEKDGMPAPDEKLLQAAERQDANYTFLAQHQAEREANMDYFSWVACSTGYKSWFCKNAAWSLFSFNAVLSAVSLNAVLCILVINGFGSILSINSAFSIASANCAFCIVSRINSVVYASMLGLFTSLHSLLDPTGMRRDCILYRTYEVIQ